MAAPIARSDCGWGSCATSATCHLDTTLFIKGRSWGALAPGAAPHFPLDGSRYTQLNYGFRVYDAPGMLRPQ